MSLAETGHPYANIITPINAYRGLRGGVLVWNDWQQLYLHFCVCASGHSGSYRARSPVCVCVCTYVCVDICRLNVHMCGCWHSGNTILHTLLLIPHQHHHHLIAPSPKAGFPFCLQGADGAQRRRTRVEESWRKGRGHRGKQRRVSRWKRNWTIEQIGCHTK